MKLQQNKFGIYISYSPAVDLRSEGLGRLMVSMIKGFVDQDEKGIVVACPAWSVPSLKLLFEDAKISLSNVELLTPKKSPAIFRVYLYYLRYQSRSRLKPDRKGIGQILRSAFHACLGAVHRILAPIRSLPLLILFVVTLTLLAGVAGVAVLTAALPLLGLFVLTRALSKAVPAYVISGTKSLIRSIGNELFGMSTFQSSLRRLFRIIEEREASLLAELANSRKDIHAWYCPAAFWPEFNAIRATRLMCVPDVVLNDFPVAFADIEGEQFMYSHSRIEKAISGGSHFVVYSEYVKWHTLVGRYGVTPENIHVIRHGASRLDAALASEPRDDISLLYRELFTLALKRKAIDCPAAKLFANGSPKFLFYASQIRPHKNVVTLLKAYMHLIRVHHIPHKLILTGSPITIPEVGRFVENNNLGNDVLFLHGLSSQELAACYHLADLALNPSLSEGGCPFTFTEALSVGTPVVMARIPVTEEVIHDEEMQAMMLFDPYDWKDMASKIGWAIRNADCLLSRQTSLYEELASRSWSQVSSEYIQLLNSLAENSVKFGSLQFASPVSRR